MFPSGFLILDGLNTLALVFGGCCSNAITLEKLTTIYPHSGSLVTFIQFLLVSIYGLLTHITFIPCWRIPVPRLRPRRIPIQSYILQVSLFYVISLLNNAAFAYRIPMPVHIIFRSGGLIVSMVLGWLVAGRRYTKIQIFSVILVMLGVIITTLSASTFEPSPVRAAGPFTLDVYVYSKGIFILSVSLVLSGFLGLLQDKTHEQYTRPRVSSAVESPRCRRNGSISQSQKEETGSAWQESMFYLHFLALPMFFFVRKDISAQLDIINLGPVTSLTLPRFLPFFPTNYPTTLPHPFTVPTAYIPLLTNACTQLLCVAGVNRLTTHMSSLTVTLVLAVRKATSLVVSVVFLRPTNGGGREAGLKMMWIGAALVMVGTFGYSIGSGVNVRGEDIKMAKLAVGEQSKPKTE